MSNVAHLEERAEWTKSLGGIDQRSGAVPIRIAAEPALPPRRSQRRLPSARYGVAFERSGVKQRRDSHSRNPCQFGRTQIRRFKLQLTHNKRTPAERRATYELASLVHPNL